MIIKQRPLLHNIDLADSFHPVIKRILASRDIKDASELDYSLKNLLPYQDLLGINDAVDLLYDALKQQARILIVADYDVDGATSCTLAIKALRQMGAQNVRFLVPNREKDGYGLTPQIVEQDSNADLLITVDNGISSISGVEAAKQQGLKVLITDHHLPGQDLPAADAIVNPNQAADKFASKNLCGVGVIFYVMMALRARLREQNWFINQSIPETNLANFLDLVALGTVADVVTLDYNNRILVEQGLRRIRADCCCPGIRALIEVAQRTQNAITSNDLAFYLGPRINAAGRMDDMSYGIACLLSDNDYAAQQHAQLMQNFNQERRLAESKMQQQALEMLDIDDQLSLGVCLFEPQWHQGIIGILASRIKDRLNRPVIVFTNDKPDFIRGSGRSVQGVHLRDIIEHIATLNPQMISYFGGHAMAAGLTIPRSQFEAFQQAFDEQVRKYISKDDLEGIILTDGNLRSEDFNLELAEQLKMLTPWGQNFPEPVFENKFELLQHRILKEKHLKMQVRPLDGGEPIDAIAFNTVDTNCVKQIQLVYKLDVNVFRGNKSLQLMVIELDSPHAP
ncbi:single-stranded-DNA-specific exonuclease RecJ [Candidatus Marithrix sp. Canyon 246]|uniref:single-stranded-DNA-specific exonuclease RecJ n=1 Tax=Candidatus Marithrix sp. Canyon 246 TaxID=1827136 RepID=UPI000849EF99|nr:single-stranded-DNA-specific exonuclease RecJ [Candidatus Marithrix sp. Canyon 246]